MKLRKGKQPAIGYSDSVATPLEDAEEETEESGELLINVNELLTFEFEETNNDDDLTQVQYELHLHYR